MNIVIHVLINVLLGFGLNLSNLNIFLLGFGGLLVDVDHVIYSYFFAGNKTISQMVAWHNQENKILRQHCYLFHTIEVLVILLVVSWFVNKYLFFLFAGFAIHVFFDILNHLVRHGKFSELLRFTLVYWILRSIFSTKNFE
jgi:hypothetical protein